MLLNTATRSLLRGPAARQLLATPPRTLRPFATSIARSATGGVSQQPGSKSFKELASNAKQEAADLTQQLGETIAASKGHGHQGGIDAIKSEISSMSSIAEKIPSTALMAGAAGLLPYAGTSLATIYLSRQAGISVASGDGSFDAETALALLHHVELLQMQYGAIILSFLGAIHWGFEFANFGGSHRERYLMGIAPVLAGWGTLLIPGQVALAGQFAAFIAMWWNDQRATTAGMAPKWYSTYRFWLTAVVGSSIILSLAGANYFGPGPYVATTGKRLKEVKGGEDVQQEVLEKSGIKLENDTEAFVKFTNVERIKEEERKEAEKKAEEERKAGKSQEQEAEKRRKDALSKA